MKEIYIREYKYIHTEWSLPVVSKHRGTCIFFLVYTFLKKHLNINFLNTFLHKFPYNLYYWLGVLLKLRKYIYKKNEKHSNLYIINIFIYSMCVMCMNVSNPKDLTLKTHFIKYQYLFISLYKRRKILSN